MNQNYYLNSLGFPFKKVKLIIDVSGIPKQHNETRRLRTWANWATPTKRQRVNWRTGAVGGCYLNVTSLTGPLHLQAKLEVERKKTQEAGFGVGWGLRAKSPLKVGVSRFEDFLAHPYAHRLLKRHYGLLVSLVAACFGECSKRDPYFKVIS